MKKTLTWCMGVVAFGAILALGIDALRKTDTLRTIAVNGECLTSVKKDKIAITLRVTVLAPTTLESMQSATTQINRITDVLKTMPVQIQTTQFNSYEKSEWNRELQKSETLGYETTIAVEVSANEMATIEEVLTRFASRPNVFTENLRMYTGPETLAPAIEGCLSVAVENARTRADALASGDNKHAGRILSISYGTDVNDSMPPQNLLRTKMVTASTMADGAVAGLVAKDTDVTVTVSAVFEIK